LARSHILSDVGEIVTVVKEPSETGQEGAVEAFSDKEYRLFVSPILTAAFTAPRAAEAPTDKSKIAVI
jgi:hypothetical protein